MRSLLLALLLAPLAAPAQPARGQSPEAPRAHVTGTVVDGAGGALPYATVLLVGTETGAVTDASGAFAFSTPERGRQRLRFSSVGYEGAERAVSLGAGDTARVDVVLREAVLDLGQAVVSADAFVAGEGMGGLSALDVVTTPGAAADLFQAIRSFPGLTEAEEGAGLFVRGGDVEETAVLLDGARLLQPYRYESPLGGTFGAVSPWLVQGTRFSTGGFSARYGGALSGVLALDSQDEPVADAQTLSLSLAAASAGADITLGEGGARVAANQSFTDALFWVNGRGGDWETAPRSTDVSALYALPTGSGGRLKLLAMGGRDKLGVRLDEPSFAGVFESEGAGGIGLAEWTGLWRGWSVGATAHHARHGSEQAIGSFRLRPSNWATGLRATAEREVTPRLIVHLGAEGAALSTRYRGEIPQGDVSDPEAAVTVFDERERGRHGGAWAEAEAKLSRTVAATVGLRADAHAATPATVDPRANVFVQVARGTRLRLAAGRYSQAPDLATVAASGETTLGTPRATHLVAGVLHERGALTLRAEAYSKRYRDLVVERSGTVYGTLGTGHARGLDLFARWGAVESAPVSGWVSYSLLDARRTAVRRDGLGAELASGRPSFGVAHSFNVVGKARVARGLSASGRFRAALGRPVTPVVGAVRAPEGDFFYPVDGVPGSETLPAYARLDLAASYTLGLGTGGALVLFGAVDNVLGRANINGFSYSPDYATREPDASPYGRSVYVGASLLLR